jgi:hypothetical protein
MAASIPPASHISCIPLSAPPLPNSATAPHHPIVRTAAAY